MAQYLSTGDVARWLGIASPTVRMLVRNRELRIAAQTEGGIHLFLPAEVYDLATRRANQAHIRRPPILSRERQPVQVP